MANGLIKSSLKTPTKFDNRYEPSFDSDGTPTCLGWKIEDVTDWVEFLGETKITFECCKSSFFCKLRSCFCKNTSENTCFQRCSVDSEKRYC